MKTNDLIKSAIANTFRSKTRTTLTTLSIFVGAFTLAITSGLGTGINDYIDDTVSAVGTADTLTVTKADEDSGHALASGDGPREYDPDAVSLGGPRGSVISLKPDDITALENIDGVLDVDPQRQISPDFIQFEDGTKFVASIGSLVSGQTTIVAAGAEPDDAASGYEVAIPQSYVDPLGFADAESAVGETVTLAISDATRAQHSVEATVVGVVEEALASPTGASILTNDALNDALFTAQSNGIAEAEADRFSSATVWFSPDATQGEIDALKDRLSEAGYSGATVADQLGTITAVIDGIVLVLNAFAIIALLAAAFGIVNTLYMSVQERTREIGLMKAIGMGSGKVFGLFSLEATFIGFLGSALGAGVAVLVGTAISARLAENVLSDLPGLTIIAFDPVSIVTIIALVMAIAFLAGTLPAGKAAKADPVESLRYE